MPQNPLKVLRTALDDALALIDLTRWQFKALHYDRNASQDASKFYLDVLLSDYDQLSDANAALHRLNKAWDSGNGDNSKWVSADGTQEYVFAYVGDAATGQFQLVTSALNQGTYNFEPSAASGGSDLDHMIMDIVPWILWGNSAQDAEHWTALDRLAEMPGGLVDKLVEGTVTALVEAIFVIDGLPRFMWGGDDSRNARAIAEHFDGGSGRDTVNYKKADGGVTASLETGKGFDGFAKGDTFVKVENLTGSQFGDILIGSDGDNTLKGLGGSDQLFAVGGNNSINGGTHDDLIFGGVTDTLIGGSGDDTIYGDYLEVGVAHGDDFIAAGQHNDWVQAGGGDDTVSGDNGLDTLLGGFGNDILDGGDGGDTIDGQEGNDTIVINHWARDVVFGGADDDVIKITKGYGHSVDGGDGYDVLDLRGMDLTRFDPANFAGIEELWTDDILITPVPLDLDKVRVFGDHLLSLGPEPAGAVRYLFGGADVEMAPDASLRMAYSGAGLGLNPASDYALTSDLQIIHGQEDSTRSSEPVWYEGVNAYTEFEVALREFEHRVLSTQADTGFFQLETTRIYQVANSQFARASSVGEQTFAQAQLTVWNAINEQDVFRFSRYESQQVEIPSWLDRLPVEPVIFGDQDPFEMANGYTNDNLLLVFGSGSDRPTLDTYGTALQWDLVWGA